MILHNLLGGPGVTDISPSSNLWHVRNYEIVSEKVYAVFLANKIDGKNIIRNGNTIVIAVGTGSLTKDIILSPFKLYKLVKRLKPQLNISYEQIFLWWNILLVRWFNKTKNILIPIAIPEKLYEITGKSFSGRFPIWFEKILRRWSFRAAAKVVTANTLPAYVEWLNGIRQAKKKLVVFEKLPETGPSINYILNMGKNREFSDNKSPVFNLISIGRLSSEKMIGHTILALAELVKRDKRFELYIIGEGAEKEKLEKLTVELGVVEHVHFEGYKNTIEIIDICSRMHVMLSPYTGGALREAALLKLPIVAYNTDWIIEGLEKDVEYGSAEYKNYKEMADKAEMVVKNPAFAEKLVSNMYRKAERLWTPFGLDKEFEQLV